MSTMKYEFYVLLITWVEYGWINYTTTLIIMFYDRKVTLFLFEKL